MDCSLSDTSVHGFSRQEYWSGLPFPSPRDLPNVGIKPGSPALQADSLLSELIYNLYVHTHTHTHTHRYIYTHTHTYMCIYMYNNKDLEPFFKDLVAEMQEIDYQGELGAQFNIY